MHEFAQALRTRVAPVLLAVLACVQSARVDAEPGNGLAVEFPTADGATVIAQFHPSPAGSWAPVVLLAHQAGSNGRGEYGSLVPELVAAGAAVVLPDLRSGAARWGFDNRTVAARGGEDPGYCAAEADLDAALSWLAATGQRGPVIAVGSSYSAALVVRLAARHPQRVAGYVAFSPASGSPMAGCEPEAAIASAGRGYVLRPEGEMSHGWIAEQFERFDVPTVRREIVPDAVHGASMLVDDRMGRDMAALRRSVLDFIHAAVRAHAVPVSFESDE